MKRTLLLLSVFIASTVWAGEPAVAPAAATTDAVKTAPAPEAGVIIEFKGSATNVKALIAELEKSELFNQDACFASSGKRSKSTKLTCAKASGGLLDFLLKNTPTKVTWRISPAPTLKACPAGCYVMPCPTTYKCCRLTTHLPC